MTKISFSGESNGEEWKNTLCCHSLWDKQTDAQDKV